MKSLMFKLGVILLGTSVLGGLLDFIIVSDQSTLSRVLIWYLVIGGIGVALILVGRKAAMGSRY